MQGEEDATAKRVKNDPPCGDNGAATCAGPAAASNTAERTDANTPAATEPVAPMDAPTTSASAPEKAAPLGPTNTELVWGIRGGGGRGRDTARRHRALDPIIPVTADALLDPVVQFYGLAAGFPLKTHLVTRCFETAERPRRCYYVSDAIRHVLMLDESESLKVTATGLKVWPLQACHCPRAALSACQKTCGCGPARNRLLMVITH